MVSVNTYFVKISINWFFLYFIVFLWKRLQKAYAVSSGSPVLQVCKSDYKFSLEKQSSFFILCKYIASLVHLACHTVYISEPFVFLSIIMYNLNFSLFDPFILKIKKNFKNRSFQDFFTFFNLEKVMWRKMHCVHLFSTPMASSVLCWCWPLPFQR